MGGDWTGSGFSIAGAGTAIFKSALREGCNAISATLCTLTLSYRVHPRYLRHLSLRKCSGLLFSQTPSSATQMARMSVNRSRYRCTNTPRNMAFIMENTSSLFSCNCETHIRITHARTHACYALLVTIGNAVAQCGRRLYRRTGTAGVTHKHKHKQIAPSGT